MSRPAILVEGLGKEYRLGRRARSFPTFREAVVDAARAPLRRLTGRAAAEPDSTFWALRNVSLRVEPGEVVGIIGRNGAGKSTLLKILSRITEPSEGSVRVRGRLASLLEVGTGFHPELTGRENVYLNGSILGMRKAEIDRKFDEIVAFAEVERFLDTQVKHYSSGMYIRLAFAVAAHLEPQILVVDEVLAVGDASFQRKCLGRLEEVTKEGRTVLFVSHNIPAIQNLCSRCVLLDRGEVRLDGDTTTVLDAYNRLTAGMTAPSQSLEGHPGRLSWAKPSMTAVRVTGGGDSPDLIRMGDDISIEVSFDLPDPIADVSLGVRVKNNMNVPIFGINTDVIPARQPDSPVKRGRITCQIGKIPVVPGLYNIDLYFGSFGLNFDEVQEACQFEVNPADVFGNGKLPPPAAGCIAWPATWEITPDDPAAADARSPVGAAAAP